MAHDEDLQITTTRAVLDRMRARADAHHMACSGVEVEGDPYFSVTNWSDKKHRLVYDLSGDVSGLVAALTAVLDAEATGAWRTGKTEVRVYDYEAWLKGYVFARTEAIKAIADALAATTRTEP